MQSLLEHLTKWSPYIWFAASVAGLLATGELLRRLVRIRAAAGDMQGIRGATSLLIRQAWSRFTLMVLYTITGILALAGRADESAAPAFQLFILLSLLMSPILLTMSSYSGLRYPKDGG